MDAKRILVVEDDRVTQRWLSGVLTPAGYEVQVAEDAATALHLIRTWLPHLVTLDIDLSVRAPADTWSGITISDWLDRLNEGQTKPAILIISGSKPEQLARDPRTLKINGFLTKPVDKTQLLEVVGSLLHQLGPHTAGPPEGGTLPV